MLPLVKGIVADILATSSAIREEQASPDGTDIRLHELAEKMKTLFFNISNIRKMQRMHNQNHDNLTIHSFFSWSSLVSLSMSKENRNASSTIWLVFIEQWFV